MFDENEGERSRGKGVKWFPYYDLKMRRALYKSFLSYVANRYRWVLSRNIKKQLFQEKFSPLSPAWLEYKIRMGWNTGFWIATGELQKSITVEWNILRQAWVVGPSKKAVHSRSGANMVFIIRCLEYGTDMIPARPLFAPTLAEVRRNLSRYYRQWLKGVRKLQAQKKITRGRRG